MQKLPTLAATALAALLLSSLAWGRDLTFADRVRAQEAIERVYYAHQIGSSGPFELAVPREGLERKVRTCLGQSSVLERRWKTPITAAMLQSELERMANGSRMPDRLKEIYAALGNDPLLVRECLARPALVDRLSRGFFAFDRELHAVTRARAEELSDRLARGTLDPTGEHPARMLVDYVLRETESESLRSPEGELHIPVSRQELARLHTGLQEERDAFVVSVVLAATAREVRVARYVVPKTSWDAWWQAVPEAVAAVPVAAVAAEDSPLPAPAAAPCGQDDTWDNGRLFQPQARNDHTAVWTGNQMIIWGGYEYGAIGTGARYNPTTDTWSPTSTVGAPSSRSYHTAVWTGSKMIVWGGALNNFPYSSTDTGGRYDPGTDSWTPTSTTGAVARYEHTAVWTGSRMIVWGGYANALSNSGGRYDPATDSWAATNLALAPTARIGHTSVWTGSVMVVWGGSTDTGARYDPVLDTWRVMSRGPSARSGHTAVWTGSRMIVWGGNDGTSAVDAGASYDPVFNTWTPTSTAGAPSARENHTAVWTGTRMVVWGGGDAGGDLDSGGRYDPSNDTWAPTATAGSAAARQDHTAVWTGALMVVWGGSGGNTTGRYDPATDTWTPTGPSTSSGAMVWTGSLMIVWGSGGGRYDPATDTWMPMSTLGAPTPREGPTAVWTGSRMIVWGGYPGLNTGGRYDPLTDSWAPTSTTGAPSPRYYHTAVWTGSRMIVWGGAGSGGNAGLNSGGIYDPATDSWTPVSATDAPSSRHLHVAVWTGNRMVVWGGAIGFGTGTTLNTGGQYDPTMDHWVATSTTNAPYRRFGHAAVWTGSRMIVWGGAGGVEELTPLLDDGGRYDPAADSWTATSTTGAPSPRWVPNAVWTGNRMVIWGGALGGGNTGGRYDAATDTWTPTSTIGAPLGGGRTLWTGSFMVVWGGDQGGGRYVVSIDDDADGFTNCDGDCNDANPDVHPGAAEVCDLADNDCDGVVDDGFDADADGFTTCWGDCDDGNAQAWGTPGEVRDLAFAADRMTLSWVAPLEPGGVVVYDTLRSPTAADFVTASCVETDDGADTLVTDVASPVSGEVFYYLTRAENACPAGHGSLGVRSSGLPRVGRDCP